MFLACITLGKPKKLNFLLWVRLGEKFMKDPVWWCGGGLVVVVVRFGFYLPQSGSRPLAIDFDFNWGVAKILKNS